MSLRLLIGRSGTGKTAFCLEEIIKQTAEDPDGDPIIYLVPDQMTFLSEYKLISSEKIKGMIRTQVFSFSRLAWKVLQETGGANRYHLNSIGMSMLIRKIIDDKKEDLLLYEKASDKTGFISQMEQILTEFRRYCVTPEELMEKVKSAEDEKVLHDKLHDLEKIYRAFEDALFEKYIDGEDYLRLLGEKLSESAYIKNASIYIDGFYSFTPQEYMIIEKLLANAKKVTIALTLDEPFYDAPPDELHLFRMSGETCQTIYEMARTEQIPIEEVFFNEQKRWKEDSLRHLERHFDSRPSIPFEYEPNIYIGEGANRRAEVEGIAREIRKLVMEEGYRYRDCAILVRNGEQYNHLIEPVFADFDIPVFIDQKRTMLNHPLIELVRSTIEMINSGYRYEAVFRAIKTELLFPLNENRAKMREKTDRLENYVLEYGIRGQKWTSGERWKYKRFRGLETVVSVQTDEEKEREDELNELREMLISPVAKLEKRLKKAGSGKELAEAVYLFLEELEIPAKLEKWKMEEEEKGELEKAREHDQAWNGMIELLDQFVEILGTEKIAMRQFSKILDSGMESLRFSLVPPAIDQVVVANLETSRLADVKAAFIIGLNEGVLPAKFSDTGLLADEDRESLMAKGLKIAPSSKTRLLDEEFLAYLAFTTPSDYLYISYPLADEEGKALIPSSYINRIQSLFPNGRKITFLNDPSELPEEEQFEYVSNANTSLSFLTGQLQLNKRGYPIYDFWWDVYNFFHSSLKWKEKAEKVLSSLNYENRGVKLDPETSKELYGETIQASVSRMELFHSCPFSHFARHGLKLREREIFKLEAPDIGELFHSALKYIVETVMKDKGSWKAVGKDEMESLAKEAVELLAPKLQHEILLSSNRHHYIKRKLEKIIRRASLVLKEQGEASGFVPVGLEIPFGPKKKLKPMAFSLKNGMKMELVGRIDRVDMAENEDGVYFRIIDYKSSESDVNISEVYYGLALQMLTYLDIITVNAEKLIGKQAMPAGVLYFHVHNPMIQATKLLTTDEIEEEILKEFKMNGLILDDLKVIKQMDKTLETGDSKLIAAGIKKDGTLKKYSKVASKDEFRTLISYVRNLYKKAGNAIIEGNVNISPYKMKDRIPCKFCSYKAVCQFDESMEGNGYRMIKQEAKDVVLEKMRKEEDGGEIIYTGKAD